MGDARPIFFAAKKLKNHKIQTFAHFVFFVAIEFYCIRKKNPAIDRNSIAKPRPFPSESPA